MPDLETLLRDQCARLRVSPTVRVEVPKKSHAYHAEAYTIDVLKKDEWDDFFNYSITCAEIHDKNGGAIKSAHNARELMEEHTRDPTLPLQVCPRSPIMSEGLITFLNKFTRLQVSTAITMAKTEDTSTSDNPEDDVIVNRIKVLIDLTASRDDLAPHLADMSNIFNNIPTTPQTSMRCSLLRGAREHRACHPPPAPDPESPPGPGENPTSLSH